MTSLITGGAGFIGSNLVRGLLERGDDVRVLDNFSTGRRDNLAGLENDVGPQVASAVLDLATIRSTVSV